MTELIKNVTFSTGAVAPRPSQFGLSAGTEPESGPGPGGMWRLGMAGLSAFAVGTASATALPRPNFASWEPMSGSAAEIETSRPPSSLDYRRLEKRLTELDTKTDAAYRSLAGQISALADQISVLVPEVIDEPSARGMLALARVAELSRTDRNFASTEWAECFDTIGDTQFQGDGITDAASRAIGAANPLIRAAAARALASVGGARAAEVIGGALEREQNAFARKIMESAARSAAL